MYVTEPPESYMCCRAGQELGPSAVLLPLHTALMTLQHSIDSNASLLGAVTNELLDTLADAAVFQELGSGNMDTVPGLMSSSRLSCLMNLLHDEAAALQSDLHLNGQQKEEQQQDNRDPTQAVQALKDDHKVHSQHKAAHKASSVNDREDHQDQQKQYAQNGTGQFQNPVGGASMRHDSLETAVGNGDSARLPLASKDSSSYGMRAIIVVAEPITAQR